MDPLKRFQDLVEAKRIIELDFPVNPQVRFGWTKPVHPELLNIISANEAEHATLLRSFSTLAGSINQIASEESNENEPHWRNDFIPAVDGISLYGFLALKNPRRFIEIGSGNSTKFARRAISDFSLRTKITSIDPAPRTYCDALCDEIVRQGLEEIDLQFFDDVCEEDIIFCDNSHRSFQNSDVTICFLEVLPRLPAGLIVGIHDIFLPHDYPPHWLNRHYNEQYLLACFLLAGAPLKVLLPVFHCMQTPHLAQLLDSFWSHPNFADAKQTGGTFWFTREDRQVHLHAR